MSLLQWLYNIVHLLHTILLYVFNALNVLIHSMKEKNISLIDFKIIFIYYLKDFRLVLNKMSTWKLQKNQYLSLHSRYEEKKIVNRNCSYFSWIKYDRSLPCQCYSGRFKKAEQFKIMFLHFQLNSVFKINKSCNVIVNKTESTQKKIMKIF